MKCCVSENAALIKESANLEQISPFSPFSFLRNIIDLDISQTFRGNLRTTGE